MNKRPQRKGMDVSSAESVDVLILYKNAQMCGTPLQESGPVAYLRGVKLVSTDPSFWVTLTADVCLFSDALGFIHFFNRSGFFAYTVIPHEWCAANGRVFRNSGLSSVPGVWTQDIIDAFPATFFAAKPEDIGSAMEICAVEKKDMIFIVDPQRYTNGRTAEEFSNLLLEALFEPGAFYDFREPKTVKRTRKTRKAARV